MGSNQLTDQYRANPFNTDVFDGYAYIKFKGESRDVGQLLFRTTEIRQKFINYFNVTLREKFKKNILSKK